MCSFSFSTIIPHGSDYNRIMRLRGPDLTRELDVNGYHLCHNLLSMRGDYVEQPYISKDGDVLVLFNGEIYNCPETEESEARFLYELYVERDKQLFEELNGEYAILICDFRKGRLLAARDCFGTKPLFFGYRGKDFGFASYRDALTRMECKGICPLQPNHVVDYALDGTSIEVTPIITFNIAQYSNDLDAWHEAFDNAVVKRVKHLKGNAFVGLSSGYDSGAITASLLANNASFLTVTVVGREDPDVIAARCQLVEASGNRAIHLSQEEIDKNKWRQWLEDNVEDEPYKVINDDGEIFQVGKSVHSDDASLFLAAVCDCAKSAGARVYLSGSGADEIYSDYGHNGHKIFAHSNFGGAYPENLLGRFPWSSFFGSTQAAYLAKEEMVAGSFGMEARYPFLDLKVVQTFLNLRAEVKNEVYKSVIRSYLEFRDFPILQGQKIGFGFESTPKPSRPQPKETKPKKPKRRWRFLTT